MASRACAHTPCVRARSVNSAPAEAEALLALARGALVLAALFGFDVGCAAPVPNQQNKNMKNGWLSWLLTLLRVCAAPPCCPPIAYRRATCRARFRPRFKFVLRRKLQVSHLKFRECDLFAVQTWNGA